MIRVRRKAGHRKPPKDESENESVCCYQDLWAERELRRKHQEEEEERLGEARSVRSRDVLG